MELKEMIQELHDARHFAQTTSRSYDLLTAAAEALALVAWADEHGAQTWRRMYKDGSTMWYCRVARPTDQYDILADGAASTILGAIRAAKEAYEAE